MKLEDVVTKAVEAFQRAGIEGWGLCISDKDLSLIGGQVLQVQGTTGCRSETCGHWSHDPAAPWFRWVPDQEDKLVVLGEDDREEEFVQWYVLRRSSGEDVYIKVTYPSHYWSRLEVIAPMNIPQWVFAGLVGSQGDE